MKKHLLLVLANELRLGLTALVASARSSEAFEATSVLEEYGILQPQARGWKRAAQKSLRVAYVAYPLWHETQLLFAPGCRTFCSSLLFDCCMQCQHRSKSLLAVWLHRLLAVAEAACYAMTRHANRAANQHETLMSLHWELPCKRPQLTV